MTKKALIKKSITDLKTAILSLEINLAFHEFLGTKDSLLEAEKTKLSIKNAEKKLEFMKQLDKKCE